MTNKLIRFDDHSDAVRFPNCGRCGKITVELLDGSFQCPDCDNIDSCKCKMPSSITVKSQNEYICDDCGKPSYPPAIPVTIN